MSNAVESGIKAAAARTKRKAISIALRNPVPSGPSDATKGIVRNDGGWDFEDPDTGEMYWVPDSNVITVHWRLE